MGNGPACHNIRCAYFNPASASNNCCTSGITNTDNCDHYKPRESPKVVCDTKKDAGKPPVALFLQNFPRAIAEVSRVIAFGDSGPGRSPGSWRTVPHFKERYQSAKARHAISGLVDDGGVDDESGLLHLAHEAWNALALLEKAMEDRMEAGDDPR